MDLDTRLGASTPAGLAFEALMRELLIEAIREDGMTAEQKKRIELALNPQHRSAQLDDLLQQLYEGAYEAAVTNASGLLNFIQYGDAGNVFLAVEEED